MDAAPPAPDVGLPCRTSSEPVTDMSCADIKNSTGGVPKAEVPPSEGEARKDAASDSGQPGAVTQVAVQECKVGRQSDISKDIRPKDNLEGKEERPWQIRGSINDGASMAGQDDHSTGLKRSNDDGPEKVKDDPSNDVRGSHIQAGQMADGNIGHTQDDALRTVQKIKPVSGDPQGKEVLDAVSPPKRTSDAEALKENADITLASVKSAKDDLVAEICVDESAVKASEGGNVPPKTRTGKEELTAHKPLAENEDISTEESTTNKVVSAEKCEPPTGDELEKTNVPTLPTTEKSDRGKSKEEKSSAKDDEPEEMDTEDHDPEEKSKVTSGGGRPVRGRGARTKTAERALATSEVMTSRTRRKRGIGDGKEEGAKKSDEESNEPDAKVPMLDLPLTVSGRRPRKQTQRYGDEYPTTFGERMPVEIPSGRGVNLGDLAYIDTQLQRTRIEELGNIYKLIFGRIGKRTEVKKNLRLFHGFSFSRGSPEYEKKLASLKGYQVSELRTVCDLLGLEKSGAKEKVVHRVLDFLIKPCETVKSAFVPKRGNKQGGDVAVESASGSGSSSSGPKRGRSRSAKVEPIVESGNSSDEYSQSGEDDDDSEWSQSDDSSGDDWRKSRTKKKPTPRSTRKSARLSTARKGKGRGKKSLPAKKAEEEEEEEEEDEEDVTEEEQVEEPPPKRSKRSQQDSSGKESAPKGDAPKRDSPSNADIRGFIKKILKGANLEEITMKTVCKQVYAEFPDHDLSDRKDFIKETVKSVIS